MAEATETREEREAYWLAGRFADDYSWEGLVNKAIPGGGQFGERTLQDYWRRDPDKGEVRDDATLKATGELIEFDGCWWHMAHLPPRGQGGGESWKADLSAAEWAKLNALMAARLAVAVETPGAFGYVGADWRWVPKASDGRALFDGAILGAGPIHPKDGAGPISVSCRRAAFLGDGDFRDEDFSAGADFFGTIFSGDAYFTRATISGDAGFRSATFSGNAEFSSATFLGNAEFSSAKFEERAHFFGATFSGNADFYGATFKECADFFGAIFKGDADFTRATISGDADFTRATFSGSAGFEGATVAGDADFTKATFSGNAGFKGATTAGDADFTRATFSGNADFASAAFKEPAWFTGRFSGRTSFAEAQFWHAVRFSAVVHHPERDFAGAFHKTQFMALADFSGAVANDQGGRLAAAFVETQFDKGLVITDGQDLAGRAQYRDHIWPAVSLGDKFKYWETERCTARAAWQEVRARRDPRRQIVRMVGAVVAQRRLEQEARRDPARNERLRQLEAGSRTLKIVMGKAQDELRMQRYYRFQLRARLARSDVDRWEKIFGAVYELLSDLGSSLWRPLAALILLTAVCGHLYAVWGASLMTGRFTPVVSQRFAFEGQAVALSALKPFSALEAPKSDTPSEPVREGVSASKSTPVPEPETVLGVLTDNPAVTLGLRVATMVQLILSTLLIFLFGLAVKRRFQIS